MKKITRKKFTHGGARPGAGRPKSPDSGVPHTRRAKVTARREVSVILRTRRDVPSLRLRPTLNAIELAIVGGWEADGFVLSSARVDKDRIQLRACAKNASALSRGVQGLSVRIARRANAALGRSGKFFADRFEVRA